MAKHSKDSYSYCSPNTYVLQYQDTFMVIDY